MQNKIMIFIMTFVFGILLLSDCHAAAKKKEEEKKEIPNPDEIWLTPIHFQILTKSGRPMNVPYIFKISLHEDGFEKVCPLVPEIVDALNIKINEKVHPANFINAKNKGKLFIEMTRFLKTKFQLRPYIYSVEIYDELPKMEQEDWGFYNRCNQMPVKLID